MIRALAIDDEPAAISTLTLMLQRYAPEITELQTSNCPQDVLHLIKTYKPDLVFLDIQMPIFTGFDLLKEIKDIDFEIIFTTAYDQYAIEAIRFSALDYLLKPIDADELKLAIGRFVERRSKTEQSRVAVYDNLLHNIRSEQQDFKLAISSSEGLYFYKPEQIIRLEAESNYTRFFFTNKKPMVVAKTLGEYEELLSPHGFLRTHRTHLVNRRYIDSFMPEGFLVMQDASKVEISRRRKEEVREALRG